MATDKSSAGREKSHSSAKQIPIGVEGLDQILLGGVPEGNIVLLEGAPGTGKTTLGLEFIYRGAAEYDEPGLIVSFELSPQKLLRDAKGFGWDFEKYQKNNKVKIIYTSPLVILQELQSHDGVLSTEIEEIGAKRLLIDGLTPLRLFGENFDQRPFRDSLHLLVESLQRMGVTAMLTREIPSQSIIQTSNYGHEEFVCDTSIRLSQKSFRRGITRSMEVTKSRGQEFISGQHTMRIVGGSGIQVFRRPQARPRRLIDQPTSETRLSFGQQSVDEMLGGGVYEGSITLAVGISGTGKTVAGVQFLTECAKNGKKGLLVTLDEHPAQICRNAKSLGFDLEKSMADGSIKIHYDSPSEVELDVHFHDIMRIIEEENIDVVVLDSLAAYESADPTEARDFIYSLATELKDKLKTAFFNYETPELLGISQISEALKASTSVDNIILLSYVEVSTALRRAITVPKARGSKTTHITREFVIGKGGILVVDENSGEAKNYPVVPQLPFSSYYGLLARAPSRQSPLIEASLYTGGEIPDSPKMKIEKPNGH